MITDVQYGYSKPLAILIDTLFSLVVVGATTFVIGRYILRDRRYWQFSLLTLFGWTAIAGVACGLIAVMPADSMPWYVWPPFFFGLACTVYAMACMLLAGFKRLAKLVSRARNR